MRRFLKFLHTMGAIGLMGASAALLVLISVAPPPGSIAGYALVRSAMASIGSWIFMPSLLLTLLSGLLAIAATSGFHNAGWAWLKLATGIVMFEGGLVHVQGPIQEEAKRSADALAGLVDGATLAQSPSAEQNLLWALLAIATANVVLGIWRPRLSRRAPALASVTEPDTEAAMPQIRRTVRSTPAASPPR